MPDLTHQSSLERPIDVLLVEDNPGDVRLTREAFGAADCETALHVVTDGDEAIDFLLQRGEHESAATPDLTLLDLNLPGRDGRDVLEAMCDDPRLRSLPVIMLTSSESSEDVAGCYESCANAYLTKPTDVDEYASIVRAVERFWFEHARLPPDPA